MAWLITTQVINFLIINNPGEVYESTFSMELFLTNMWLGNESWPYLDTDKFFGNPRCFLTLFGGIWIIIPLMWKYINTLNRRYLLLVPIYLTPAFLYANLMESRVYHEINVVLTAVIVSCISNFIEK
ncbi:MAG: hypothetical protein P8P37_04540, partial [Candidatus Marinimicrobia bacterium]|nr:hypothetical protein [Candidatus Neomarinimicrobiota bacterium]